MRSARPESRPAQGEWMGRDLLQTVSAIASILGFFLSLTTFVPFFGSPAPQAPITADVLRLFGHEGKIAVLVWSTPIFGLLNTVLVISLARISLSILRSCGVEIDNDTGALLILVFVLLPVAVGSNLAFAIVLFGDVASAPPIACILANLVVTCYCAFRWLQNTIY